MAPLILTSEGPSKSLRTLNWEYEEQVAWGTEGEIDEPRLA